MAEPLEKSNLRLCFTKMKFPLCAESPMSPAAAGTVPSTTTTTAAAAALFKNFNSLFDASTSSSHSSTEPDGDDTLPDLTSAYASHRFFFSSPGRSNSITESASVSSPDPVVSHSVAVPTYSPDPYSDFRRSMQEMVDARQMFDVKSNWEYLHELLLCYLALNPKNTHKFIVGAFADLLVSLMSGGGGDGNHHRSKP